MGRGEAVGDCGWAGSSAAAWLAPEGNKVAVDVEWEVWGRATELPCNDYLILDLIYWKFPFALVEVWSYVQFMGWLRYSHAAK
jgi:hypothetical protein